MKRIRFKIAGKTPILPHKFNGLDEEKRIKELSAEEQAEKRLYLCKNGNIGVPSSWIRGCLINEYIRTAGNKKKTLEKERVSPRISVNPMMLDTGLTDYEIDVRSVPSGGRRGGVRSMCVRPIIEEWAVEGELITSLQYSIKDLKSKFASAGENIGIGSNRINGYGRFTVIEFEQLE